jgi:hypothetical protein
MASIDEMEQRARKQLDGMRVNHDVMARDVLSLIELVGALRAQLARAQVERVTIHPPRAASGEVDMSALPEGFEDLFAGLGRRTGH